MKKCKIKEKKVWLFLPKVRGSYKLICIIYLYLYIKGAKNHSYDDLDFCLKIEEILKSHQRETNTLCAEQNVYTFLNLVFYR